MADLTQQLLGDAELEAFFTAKADIAAMVRFEGALASAQAECQIIGKDVSAKIIEASETFNADIAAIEEATARDGVPVPELVRQMREHIGQPENERLHFGATSQDVIDSSLVLRLSQCIEVLKNRIISNIELLDSHIERFGDNNLVGRTRMQRAISITVQDRLVAWKTPLKRHLIRLEEIKPRLLQVQLGGAAGTLDKLGFNAGDVKKSLAENLGLRHSAANWHTCRDNMAEFANWLSLVSGSIGKIGQDIVLMAQNEFAEIKLSGGGGSSAMPHKQNPVGAEALVTLARFNATQLSAMHHALVHEQERSGAAWTLEWMVLPQMVISTGASTRRLKALLSDIEQIGGD